MNWKNTLASLLRPAVRPQNAGLRGALEAGQQAKFAEDYDRALELLDRASGLARQTGDRAAETVAELHKSEIHMRQGRHDEAEAANKRILASAPDDIHRSYTYTLMGMVAQSQGDWVTARADYERGVELARAAHSDSAEGRALGRLGDTYLHDANASYAAHLLRDALPKLANSGDVEPSSYITGLMGLALIASGQDAEGQHLLDRALRIAEQLGYRGYERHWALLLGDHALEEGRYQDAYTYYNHVLRLFPPESVDPEYALAVARMSRACLSLRKSEEALSYAKIALTSANRLDDAALQRQAEGALGMALRAVGHSSDAIPHLQAAGEDVQVLRSLAAAQADSGDTDASVATYQRAVTLAPAASLELAQARRDLGLVYARRSELQAAINEWSAALAIYDEARAYAQVARLYCDIGSARKGLGQRARAMKDYEQALMLLNSLNGDQETRGLVLSNSANAYAEQGDADSADAFFTEAISIAETLGDRAAESTRSGNYGWFLLLVGRPRRAIATLERALTLSQPRGLIPQAAIQLDNLGLAYDTLGDIPAALERHRAALALVTDPAWAAQFKVNLACTLIASRSSAGAASAAPDTLDEAQSLLEAALETARAGLPAELLISALIGTARLAVARQQPAAAEDALAEAIALARKLDHRRLLAEALALRSQQQAALDRPDEAAASWEEAQRLYLMLHMPQGKTQPVWLTPSATRT